MLQQFCDWWSYSEVNIPDLSSYFVLFYYYYPFCIVLAFTSWTKLQIITKMYVYFVVHEFFITLFIHILNFTVFRPHPCRSGLPQSRGYGFVEFQHHTHALACLRELNNNPAHGKFATTGTVLCTRCFFFLKTFSYFVFLLSVIFWSDHTPYLIFIWLFLFFTFYISIFLFFRFISDLLFFFDVFSILNPHQKLNFDFLALLMIHFLRFIPPFFSFFFTVGKEKSRLIIEFCLENVRKVLFRRQIFIYGFFFELHAIASYLMYTFILFIELGYGFERKRN